jgi:hypothetical protein
VRLRHELGEQRSEWQQRIQATLYHHGCPQRRGLMVADGRAWLAAQPLPVTAREQVTVALAMIDGIEAQIVAIEKELRSFARRQPGCKALMVHRDRGADRGHDPLRARGLHPVLLLGVKRSATPAWTSPSINLIGTARRGTSPAKDRRRFAGRCMKPPRSPAGLGRLTATTTSRRPSGSVATERACQSRASCSSAAITRCVSSDRRHSPPHDP